MLYSLKCGNCLTDNNVSATDEPIGWICNDCINDNTSSLPRTGTKTMVTDYTKAKSLLSPVQESSATRIVTATKLDISGTKTAEDPVVKEPVAGSK